VKTKSDTRLAQWLGRYGGVAAALGLGLVAAAPLLANGGFLLTRGGGDSPFLLLRLQQLLAALGSGQFPARWMPDADYGYGYPFFHYYAALPYHLAALFKVYGFSYNAALELTQAAALLLGAVGAYAWARGLRSGAAPAGLSRPQAVLAAAAFTFAPFHLANLYVRGDSLSELWAMSFYPLGLWTAQRCLTAPSLQRAAALAAVTGLLVLTHNISALNFLPFMALALLLGWLPRTRSSAGADGHAPQPQEWAGERANGRMAPMQPTPQWRRQGALWPLAAAGLALAWGLALAAFFWLPALSEIGAVQIGDVTEGYFFYANHFRGADLVQRSLFYNAETGAGLPTPFAMGLAQAALAGLGLAALAARAARARRWTSGDSLLVLGLALSTWMITPASAWAWEHLPLVRFTQFPWRFLSIQALFAAGLAAHVVPPGRPPESAFRVRAGQWALAVGLGLALALLGMGRLRPEFVPLADDDVTAERMQLLEYFSANIGSTIGYEYLPRAVTPRPYASETLLGRAPRLKVVSGQASGTRDWQRGAAEGWRVEVSGGPARVALPRHNWPGWRVNVDGQPAVVQTLEGLGWIAVDLAPGAHMVEAWLGATPIRTAAEGLSLAAALALAATALAGSFGRRMEFAPAGTAAFVRRRSPRSARTLLIAAGALGVLLAGSLVLRGRRPDPSTLPLSIDFEQLTLWHRDVVRFAGGAQLVEAAYAADSPDRPGVARGDTLRVTSIWQGADGLQATLALAPASNLLSQAPATLASDSVVLAGAESSAVHTLRIPSDVPPGVYFVTVTLADAGGLRTPLTARGRARGQVHLAPVWIDDAGTEAGAGMAALGQFTVPLVLRQAGGATPAPGVLRLDLTWEALGDLAGNYQAALRLRDAAGFEWASVDAQAAYGFYPTHFWRPGEVVPDYYLLALSEGTPPGEYRVDLNLYAAPGLESLGTAAFPVTLAQATPRGDRTAQHALTAEIELGAVRLPAQFDQGAAPEFQAEWLTIGAPSRAYRARWSLLGPGGERIPQVLELAPGSSTTNWPGQAFILGRARFGTDAALAPGRYQVTLALVDEAGQPVSAEIMAGEVEVKGRPRTFNVPSLQTTIGASFGEVLVLHGYDAQRTAGQLRLTLAWGALAAPGRDYKFFVHLFNPADGFVVQQVDAIPRDFGYPTALWVAGEVVTDTVEFEVSDLAPGSYRLAAGWYDPNSPNLERLAAADAQGTPLAGDQVVLPLVVEVP
jgi:hypothetical protein